MAETADPSDPYLREAQTFPRLSPEMAGRVASYGREERLPDGALLFERGQRSVDFFLVLEGAVEIFDTEDGRPNVFTVHGERQFTGELDLFNDREILVSGRARGETRVVRVRRETFRRLVMGEPDIGEIVMRAFILRRTGLIQHQQGAVTLVGPGHGGDTLRLQRFLSRNGYPLRLLDTEVDPDGHGLVRGFDLRPEMLPVVILPDHQVLRNPSVPQLADELGIAEQVEAGKVHDVAVVGAGPAGLAAAVYAASEGLETVVIETMAPGGQAGTSSKIENYLGFPTGISGQALAARAWTQAQKFGAKLAISREAVGLDCEGPPFHVELEDGRSIQARSVIIATGARYRKLDLPEYDRFEGQGIHYAATALEAALCRQEEVVIVGGGNSAGQAAMYLSGHAAHVHILVRGEGLAATMSDYLIQRIDQSERITLHPFTEIVRLEGGPGLSHVTWRNQRSGEEERRVIRNLFVMIGAVPNTGWLRDCLPLDDKGFIVTGRDQVGMALPSPYATTRPGIFAVGDVRAGSVKRVASGVGEGAVVVAAVHQFLAPGTA